MSLGGQSGHAFVRRLRDLDVSVIAISGSAKLLVGNPTVARLQKPFSGRELLDAVHRLIAPDESPVVAVNY